MYVCVYIEREEEEEEVNPRREKGVNSGGGGGGGVGLFGGRGTGGEMCWKGDDVWKCLLFLLSVMKRFCSFGVLKSFRIIFRSEF